MAWIETDDGGYIKDDKDAGLTSEEIMPLVYMGTALVAIIVVAVIVLILLPAA